MNLTSLTICRDSAWCIEATLTHALRYCDQAVVLCHATTDGTQDILKAMDRVDVIEEPDATKWNEMHDRQKTLDRGRELGGTHFLILDDDEVAADPMVPTMRKAAEALNPGEILMQAMVCCWRDLDHYRCDKQTNPFARLYKSTVFADAPELSWRPQGDYHHHHTHPYGSYQLRPGPGPYRWLHLQHSSWPRLVTKQCHYMCMELLRYGEVKADYRRTMSEHGLERREIPADWWADGLKDMIDLEAEPWQLGDLKKMIKAKGIQFFRANDIPVDKALSYWR